MLSVSGTTPSSATVDPDVVHHRWTGPLVVLIAATLLVVGLADVQVAHRRSTVERSLATVRVAAARVPDHLAVGDGDAVRADLDLLIRSAKVTRAGSSGLGWAVADRTDLGGDRIAAVRRADRQASVLAAAAVRLRTELTPLTQDPAAVSLDDLDALARGLSRYATAARRSGDPSVVDLERAAAAAGLLPDLAGAEGPREWTVCRASSEACTRATVDAGSTTDARPRSSGSSGADLLVVGRPARAIFPPAGGWNAASAFAMLYNLDARTVTVHSVIGTEQRTIDELSRRNR
jgi:hypothetical protein